jgi:signal transduction histidine kinase/CheY-like chemotaxis protein
MLLPRVTRARRVRATTTSTRESGARGNPSPNDTTMTAVATQRIVKVRRDYNTWVANETLEDYALRFAPVSFRKWSEFRVANTALGAVSFLALEAIGGSLAVNYGFVNAVWAIAVVGLIILLTGIPIGYYASKYGLDMDLLTRGAGFGYIGSTVTSLVYASFTFIFFAIEAAIMSLALELCFGIPLTFGYLLSSLAVIPLVTHGITLISRLQSWTQPLWVALLVVPYACVLWKDPSLLHAWTGFAGKSGEPGRFDPMLFGAAATVAFSLVAQIGEQVDFLRFLPERRPSNAGRWWIAMLAAGPGWILPGMLKMLGGAFLAFLCLQHEVPAERAVDPTQMYLTAFKSVFSSPLLAVGATTLYVVVSQVKINVTNAYAGSLAWSNFFARLTHSHPGRVVWLVFNVLIALVLMEIGVFKALEQVLGLYANVAIAWIGALVADLVINKPLGLSPPGIEFKRAYLYDINPVGVGSMVFASLLAISAHAGLLGHLLQPFSSFIALLAAFLAAPAIAYWTRGRYYLARVDAPEDAHAREGKKCCICGNAFEQPDMATCPVYADTICSLCCSLDARCLDSCKPNARTSEQIGSMLGAFLPSRIAQVLQTRVGHYLLVLALLIAAVAVILGVVYYQETLVFGALPASNTIALKEVFGTLFAVLVLISGVGAWFVVLAAESRKVAHEESKRQTHLLMREIEAHRETDAKLQRAKEAAEAANLAKSRYLTGMSHELRTPLNSILGYAQILQRDDSIPAPRREAVNVIRRSGEHLLALINGLLDIARIEAGKLQLNRDETRLPEFLDDLVRMFELQAREKGLEFKFDPVSRVPAVVHVDERRLGQILINLLGNAVKFTPTGRVTLRFTYQGEMARFEVEDTGPGIPAGDLERIFLPFERGLSGTGVASDVGTGLGLAISRMLAALMGGELTVRSEAGRGSAFQVKLFMSEVRAPAPRKPLRERVGGYLGTRRKVLVVDDQPEHRALLADLLGPVGFEVGLAVSGQECLDVVAAYRPDLILLDLAMPGLDGWETARRMRAAGVTLAPIIAVSANAHENDPGRRAQVGIVEFVTKPVHVPELFAKIRATLGIEWIDLAQPKPAPEPAAPVPHSAAPSGEVLARLLQYGRIGYVKGILEVLSELEVEGDRYRGFVAEQRRLASNYRLADLVERLETLSRHEPDPS